MKKTYTAAFKAEVVREVLREQKTINQIASEYALHPHQIYRWRDQVLAAIPNAFSDKAAKEQATTQAAHEQEIQTLHAEIGKLTVQLNWLKKKAGHLLHE